MPFALLSIGILLIVVAVRSRQTEFVQLLKSDFTGPGNFMYWVVAIVIIGSIGYIEKAKPAANLFLVLILIALILTRGNSSGAHAGVFQQLTDALGMTAGSSGSSAAGSAAAQLSGPEPIVIPLPSGTPPLTGQTN